VTHFHFVMMNTIYFLIVCLLGIFSPLTFICGRLFWLCSFLRFILAIFCVVTGNVVPLKMKKGHSLLRVGLGWETPEMDSPVDLDVSCAALDIYGQILMEESVYFGNLRNPNGSIVHSGDEREGAGMVDATGVNDDREQISIDLDRLPPYVAAYVLLVTVATPGVNFSRITSARVRIVDAKNGVGFCVFRPAYEGECTAMFCLRLFRERRGRGSFAKGWSLATIGATDVSGRDFGETLLPSHRPRHCVPSCLFVRQRSCG